MQEEAEQVQYYNDHSFLFGSEIVILTSAVINLFKLNHNTSYGDPQMSYIFENLTNTLDVLPY